jgi:two-component system response regulator DesR
MSIHAVDLQRGSMTCQPAPSTDPVPGSAAQPAKHPGLAEQTELIAVLVVDHDARVRRAIAEPIALEADMTLVGEAADACSAMTLAAASSPVVALVDVQLPDERTGLSLVRTLAERPRCAVVVMSVDSGVRNTALAAGATAFIEKADDIDALLRSIRTAAQSSS